MYRTITKTIKEVFELSQEEKNKAEVTESYKELVKKIGGHVIKLKTSSDGVINPLDLELLDDK